MRYLQNYNIFKESLSFDTTFGNIDLMESLSVVHDILLSSVGAEQVDIFDAFKLPKEEFEGRLDIIKLSENVEFLNSLASLGLKKSAVYNTQDFQTFLNKPCKFMLIYDISSNELENPEYMLFQVWIESNQNWDEAKLYKLTQGITRFFDKLTSKTIELIDGDMNFIYTTSNGNEWHLQNVEDENDIFKKYLRKDQLQEILDKSKITINII